MKAPWKILWTNDTLNIAACASPWHRSGEQLRPEMLDASVDEAAQAGVQAQLLQPGLGTVPLWRSEQYGMDAHAAFMQERWGLEPDALSRWVLEGGDVVERFAARCRERETAALVSLRLNDVAGKELAAGASPDALAGVPGLAWQAVSRFYAEHPEWRIDSEGDDWRGRGLNWAVPEVRDRAFGFVRELCARDDIDGVELDLMRYCRLFREEETPPEERRRILTEFVAQVRKSLDESSGADARRWLGVRVPAYRSAHEALGVDMAALVDAGVDMVTLSHYFFTEQRGDCAEARRDVRDASLYLEMTPVTRVAPLAEGGPAYDGFPFRRTTPTQFYTTAHLAYSRGLDGVSLHNWAYYREHGAPDRGPWCEPPWRAVPHLGDPEWLARQEHHYFVGETWNEPPLPDRPLPRRFEAETTHTWRLNLCPTERGWRSDGKLRIQGTERLVSGYWTATVNGEKCEETDDRSEPFETPSEALLGGPEHHRAWVVPSLALKNGLNDVAVTLHGGEPATVVFVDLAMVEKLR
jgi:hypothetical protein